VELKEANEMSGLIDQDSGLAHMGMMLLNGYGYNCYSIPDKMRSDDTLVRQQATHYLCEALAKLKEVEGNYRRRYLPPPSREHPFPDPQCLEKVREFAALQATIASTETKVRGASMPPNDKVWQMHRTELDTLRRLGRCDMELVGGTMELAECAKNLENADGLDDGAISRINESVSRIKDILAKRDAILVV
jgi:hypothetical protein